MIDSRIKGVILSPEDVATHRRWRRVVGAFYAGIFLILAAVWAMHQGVTPPGGIQMAGTAGHGLEAAAAHRH